MSSSTDTGRAIQVTRMLDAPRDLVWRVWTEPEHVARWWGPEGYTNTIHEMDVRVGGRWRLTMHGPDGADHLNEMVFHEVAEPERLVYRHGPEPLFLATITFEEQGGMTKVTLHALFDTRRQRDEVVEKFNAVQGAHQTLGKLASYLEAMQ